jgi:hypothetical protein
VFEAVHGSKKVVFIAFLSLIRDMSKWGPTYNLLNPAMGFASISDSKAILRVSESAASCQSKEIQVKDSLYSRVYNECKNLSAIGNAPKKVQESELSITKSLLESLVNDASLPTYTGMMNGLMNALSTINHIFTVINCV